MPLISRQERLRLPQIAGLLLAFAALAYTFDAPSKASLETRWLWELLAICGGLFWGLTTLAVRATPLSGAAPERTLFFQLAFSAPLLLCGAVVTGEPWPSPSWQGALTVGFQSIIVASTSYLVWFWMLRHYPATKLAAFTFLTPMFGMMFGVLLLQEPASAAMFGGLAGVAAGIWLVNRPERSRTPKR
jgi:drug/metabolite transporter (DMT)-like permease